MPAWVVPAITAAGSIIGTAIAKGRNKTQIDQQQKLNDIALGTNQKLALYNKNLQMEMWEQTGPTGQMEQLKKAGLNPGLIYGMGGAGGQTANAAQAQGVSTAQAQGRTGNEEFQATSMGLELATRMGLLKAQKENIEADTELKKADATKTTGIDTTLAQTTNRIATIEEKIKGDTAENAINTVRIEMLKANQELEQQVRNNTISQETYQQQIDKIKAESAGVILANELTKQQTKEGISKIQVNTAQIAKMAADILQGWSKLSIEAQNAATMKFNAEVKAQYPSIMQIPGSMIKDIMDSIGRELSGGTREEHTTVPNK